MTSNDLIGILQRDLIADANDWHREVIVSVIAKLRAADELATYAERHLNYSDTRIPSLIAAYRNTGEETK